MLYLEALDRGRKGDRGLPSVRSPAGKVDVKGPISSSPPRVVVAELEAAARG